MAISTTLSPSDLKRAVGLFADLLRRDQGAINRLNVYPVPDGDTGTNMALTMAAVVADVSVLDESATLADFSRAVSHGALMGARGNSGVILAQMLRGLVSAFEGKDVVEATEFVEGLRRADESARRAVERPVEGTILSVARAAARAVEGFSRLVEVVRSARAAAREALAKTTGQLEVLARAGVVDSGGTGLVLWFEALCHVVAGDELPPPLFTEGTLGVDSDHAGEAVGDQRYEVMFILEGEDDLMGEFRASWSVIGDSIVVVGSEGLYNCHIHTNDIGGAIEAALVVGRPSSIRVSDLSEQVLSHREPEVVAPTPTEIVECAVVAVTAGPGLSTLFSALGSRALVSGGQSMNPPTADLIAAVTKSRGASVVILPNNPNVRLAAEQVGDLVEIPVAVVATESAVQGLAAMLAYSSARCLDENVEAMSEAAAAVTSYELTRAVRDAVTDRGPVREGEWIGVSGKEVVTVSGDLETGLVALVEHALGESDELLTVLEGEGSRPEVTERLRRFVNENYPDVDVEVHRGDQPVYAYLLGVE
jgi:DAK2 domain fusion protein YloV